LLLFANEPVVLKSGAPLGLVDIVFPHRNAPWASAQPCRRIRTDCTTEPHEPLRLVWY
jgi:hypothetical protein